MRPYRLSLSLEELEALANRLVPISPSEYDLHSFSLLRDLYGRITHLILSAKTTEAMFQTSNYAPDPRD